MFTTQPVLTQYDVRLSRLPEAFDGFSIALISDLHGQVAQSLLEQLRACRPELIAVTGDLIDSGKPKTAAALSFLREALAIAPCFFVPGNHESSLPAYPRIREGLQQLGMTVLEDRAVSFHRGSSEIWLQGLADPGFPGGEDRMERALAAMCGNDRFRLLLSHRPEYFPMYARYGVDLTLSGHAHGGQIRLPGVNGLFAPGQGFFPKWAGGVYQEANSTLIVSRGLSHCPPLRIGNPTELVSITLHI